MNAKFKTIIYIFSLFIIFPRPAHAYLDPSTGSYLFQFLIAGILGGTFFLRGTLQNLINKLTGKSKKVSSKDDDKDDNDQDN